EIVVAAIRIVERRIALHVASTAGTAHREGIAEFAVGRDHHRLPTIAELRIGLPRRGNARRRSLRQVHAPARGFEKPGIERTEGGKRNRETGRDERRAEGKAARGIAL